LRPAKQQEEWKELQDIYNANQAVIQKAIVEAFRRGLVDIKKVDAPDFPERKMGEPRAKKLLSRFRSLANAIVIRREKGSLGQNRKI